MSLMTHEAHPKENWRTEMGGRLLIELQKMGMNQTDLSRRLGFSKQLISHWLSGRSEITAETLRQLDKMGIDASFVLLGRRSSALGERSAPTVDAVKLLNIANELSTLAASILKGC
jgi:transcriptional regulator with XRE-family HTH domain